jgi:hypothetical protein
MQKGFDLPDRWPYVWIIETQPRRTTMNTLTTLKKITEALAESGAVLICDHRGAIGHNEHWYVRRFNGQLIRCTKVADRLTWGGPRAKVTFKGRETSGLVRVYEPK